MGADFDDKAKKSFEKAWNGGVRKTSQPTLFDALTRSKPRSVVARLAHGSHCRVGEKVHVERVEGNLILTKNMMTIGSIEQPPSELLDAVRGNGADCSLAVVEQVNVLSQTVEVSLADE